MKKSLDCYDNLLDIERIMDVYHIIRLNSKHKDKLFLFELFFSCNIFAIYEMLKARNYHHHQYNIFLLKDPKYRVIMSEVISDKIVNHLVSKYVLFPILEAKLIPMNVATREGMGTKMGIFYVKKYMNYLKQKSERFYVLKCDISKYFYSIDHDILYKKLQGIIHDTDLLNILKEIIYSTNYSYVNDKIDEAIDEEIRWLRQRRPHDLEHKIAQLQKIPRYQNHKGLPIGNMTSQILAIYYLNDLDHFIKEKLRIKHYVRYMDDFILFHEDKQYLNYCLEQIKMKLADIKLSLNNKTQIIEVHHGFCFLGYKFILKNKKLLVLIRGQTKKRIRKKIRYLNKKHPENEEAVLASYRGYLQSADSGSFCYQNHLK